MNTLPGKLPESDYRQQARISIHRYGKGLAISAGGTLKNNTYLWQKNGATNQQWIKNGDSTFYPTESGVYIAYVSNRIATDLTLYTDTVSYTACPSEISISVYPNPLISSLTLYSLNPESNAKITITDISGTIWISLMSNHQLSIKSLASQLKPGNYLITINNGKEVKTIQFVKQ